MSQTEPEPRSIPHSALRWANTESHIAQLGVWLIKGHPHVLEWSRVTGQLVLTEAMGGARRSAKLIGTYRSKFQLMRALHRAGIDTSANVATGPLDPRFPFVSGRLLINAFFTTERPRQPGQEQYLFRFPLETSPEIFSTLFDIEMRDAKGLLDVDDSPGGYVDKLVWDPGTHVARVVSDTGTVVILGLWQSEQEVKNALFPDGSATFSELVQRAQSEATEMSYEEVRAARPGLDPELQVQLITDISEFSPFVRLAIAAAKNTGAGGRAYYSRHLPGSDHGEEYTFLFGLPPQQVAPGILDELQLVSALEGMRKAAVALGGPSAALRAEGVRTAVSGNPWHTTTNYGIYQRRLVATELHHMNSAPSMGLASTEIGARIVVLSAPRSGLGFEELTLEVGHDTRSLALRAAGWTPTESGWASPRDHDENFYIASGNLVPTLPWNTCQAQDLTAEWERANPITRGGTETTLDSL